MSWMQHLQRVADLEERVAALEGRSQTLEELAKKGNEVADGVFEQLREDIAWLKVQVAELRGKRETLTLKREPK